MQEKMKNKERKTELMEKIIACTMLAGYAILVNLQAAVLRGRAASIHDFQVLPMTIWGAVISVAAVIFVFLAFRSELQKAAKTRRAGKRQK